MKCQIARGVRVFITKEEYQFVQDMKGQTPFLLHKLPIEQQRLAQRLGDKAIFVRPKREIFIMSEFVIFKPVRSISAKPSL